ncbi:MAG TPA: hypothetical protein PK417_05000 [Hyphomonas sp.]|nr:hypothetical protein [Hyphomonas sp.]HRX73042.1 hypothetical protein [Hyphomonas sp.]
MAQKSLSQEFDPLSVTTIGVTLAMVLLVGCTRTEYLNADECAEFARVLKGPGEVVVAIDQERCNMDIEYFRSMSVLSAEAQAPTFVAEQAASFGEFNSYFAVLQPIAGALLETPPHDSVVLTEDYSGPGSYRLVGQVSFVSDPETFSTGVWYRSGPEDRRFWSFDTYRIPPYLFEGVKTCGAPYWCNGELSILVLSQDEYGVLNRATVSHARLEAADVGDAEAMIESLTGFCVSVGGRIDCE